MKTINRRAFVGTAAVALAAGASVRLLRSDEPVQGRPQLDEPVDERIADLRQTFHYLSISDDVLDAFMKALTERGGKVSNARMRELFLLSTDFFAQGADERKPLSFVTLYDPFLNPCYNPMERDA
jgi:hypothetical protein